MKQKTLSSSPQKFFQEMPLPALDIARYIFGRLYHSPLVKISQRRIGEVAFVNKTLSRDNVNRHMNYLLDNDIIAIAKKRFKESITYRIGSKFLERAWYNELYHWFDKYPVYLSLGLLFSGVCNTGPTQSYSGHMIVKTLTFLTFFNERLSMGNEAGMEVAHSDKIRGICLALKKRGAEISNDDALNMTAFNITVLERVIGAMRTAKNIQNVKAFFFGLCRKFATEAGEVIDWQRVQLLTDKKVRLLNKSEEGKDPQPDIQVPLNAEQRGSQQRDERRLTYMDQVREIMGVEKKKAEERKAPVIKDVDAEIATISKSLIEAETMMNSGNEYAQYTVKALRDKLNHLLGIPEERVEIKRANVSGENKIKAGETIYDVNVSTMRPREEVSPKVKLEATKGLPLQSVSDVLRGSPFMTPEQVPDTLPTTKKITELFRVESITVEAVYPE